MFYHLKMGEFEKVKAIFSSDCTNKRLKCYDRWKKFFWSTSEKWFKNRQFKNNIQAIAAGQGDDNRTRCLPDFSYFKEHYKLIAIDLSKQQKKIDVDPKAIQRDNSNGNPEQDGNTQKIFIIEEVKETVLHISKRAVEVLWFHFVLI